MWVDLINFQSKVDTFPPSHSVTSYGFYYLLLFLGFFLFVLTTDKKHKWLFSTWISKWITVIISSVLTGSLAHYNAWKIKKVSALKSTVQKTDSKRLGPAMRKESDITGFVCLVDLIISHIFWPQITICERENISGLKTTNLNYMNSHLGFNV